MADTVTAYLESVQQRLKQAEIDKAQAQTKAQEERKRRRVQLALAATVMFTIIGAGIAGFWYQNDLAKRAAKDFKIATERRIQMTDAITKSETILAQLRRKIDMGRGVQTLLNNRQAWREAFASARTAHDFAENLRRDAESEVDSQLINRLKRIKEQIGEHNRDMQLIDQLENAREAYAVWTIDRFDYKTATKRFPKAFAGGGFDFDNTSDADLVQRLKNSRIRHYLVAAVDDWHLVSRNVNNLQLSRRLIEIASKADSNPMLIKLRETALRRETKELLQLIRNMQDQPDLLKKLSPQMFMLVARILQFYGEDPENWCRQGLVYHPADFWLNSRLGNLLRGKKRYTAAIGYAQTAVAIRPDNSAAWTNLGVDLSYMNRPKESLVGQRHFDTIRSRKPLTATTVYDSDSVKVALSN